MSDNPIATALAGILLPLEDAVRRPAALRALLASLDVHVDVDGPLRERLESLLAAGPALADLVAAVEPLDAEALLDAAERVLAAIDALRSADTQQLAALPPPLDDPATWRRLADDLPVQLVAAWLGDAAPVVLAFLEAGGVVTRSDAGPHSWTPRFSADLASLGGFVTDPLGRIGANLGWGQQLRWEHMLELVAGAVARMGPVDRDLVAWEVADRHYGGVRPLPTEAQGLAWGPGPLVSADRANRGRFDLAVTPVGDGALSLPIGVHVALAGWQAPASAQLGTGLSLDVRGLEESAGAGLALTPAGATSYDGVAGDGVGITLRHVPAETLLLLGSRQGTRIELDGAGVSVDLRAPQGGDGPELVVGVLLDGLRLVIGEGALGAFLSLFVGAIDSNVDLALELSSTRGFRFNGAPGLALHLSDAIPIGPVTLHDVEVGLEEGAGGGIVLYSSGALAFGFGPFAASVDGIGVQAELVPGGGGNLGPVDLALRVRPPTGIGLALDAGVVSGAGYLSIEGDRYVGALSVDVLELGLDAFTIIDTSLPGGASGFALFATLSLRFPSIPLGFGFSLSGLGGILALNRRVDTEALALGIRDGAADAVLFMEDPVRDAPVLVRLIDEYFPISDGSTVVGPIAEISWGVGNIITGQLGVIATAPDGVFVLLGSVEAILPDPEAPVLELHLDTVGTLDPEAGTLLVLASLYDSRLLGVIELSGDAAVYLAWLTHPYFLLSVGGFHPGFQPPACTPAVLETLRPMRAEVRIGQAVTAVLEAYFAVTSNTVQFGGGFEIKAADEFAGVTYTARGWFDFDVLIKFSPFLISMDASAGVGVYAGERELMGVTLEVHLEGPEPWYASGFARFTFFAIKVRLDFAIGGKAPPVLPPSSDVLDLVRAELESAAAWSVERPSGVVAGVRFATDAHDLVRPDDLLVARQTIAPFDRPLARFGETTPEQSEVTVTTTAVVEVVDGVDGDSIGELSGETVLDWFAPALYSVLPERARLSAPSYELMPAGVRIGAAGVGLPVADAIAAPEGHETEVWEPGTDRVQALGVVVAWRPPVAVVAASTGGRQATALRGPAVEVDRVALGSQRYAVIDRLSGQATSGDLSYAEAVAAADGHRVAPVHAGSER